MKKRIKLKEVSEEIADVVCEMNYIRKDDLMMTIQAILSIYQILEVSDIEMETLMVDRINIETQLNMAKADIKEGVYVDMKWYARANHAYRMKGFLLEKAKNTAAYKKRMHELEEKRKVWKEAELITSKEYQSFKKLLKEKNPSLYNEIIFELFKIQL